MELWPTSNLGDYLGNNKWPEGVDGYWWVSSSINCCLQCAIYKFSCKIVINYNEGSECKLHCKLIYQINYKRLKTENCSSICIIRLGQQVVWVCRSTNRNCDWFYWYWTLSHSIIISRDHSNQIIAILHKRKFRISIQYIENSLNTNTIKVYIQLNSINDNKLYRLITNHLFINLKMQQRGASRDALTFYWEFIDKFLINYNKILIKNYHLITLKLKL